MPINSRKLEAALRSSRRVRGVGVHKVIDLSVEKLLVDRQLDLWDRGSRAALAEVSGLLGDVSVSDAPKVKQAVAAVYKKHSKYATLVGKMEVPFERAGKLHKKEFLAKIEKSIGTPIGDLLDDKKAARAIRTRLEQSLKYIKKVDEKTQKRIADTVLDGLKKGKSKTDLEKQLSRMRSLPKSRAKLIARDQVGKLYGNLAKARQEDIGVTKYRWVTVGDSKVRAKHRAREGKIFSWSDPPEGGHPGEDINCRCTAEPILKSSKILREMARSAA